MHEVAELNSVTTSTSIPAVGCPCDVATVWELFLGLFVIDERGEFSS
jgi:hypothetical protein